jgi:hypothetical protein
MTIYTPITPTYLYIKQHSVTGLKYFGMTTKKDPIKYYGSGTYWVKHIKKHGKKYIKTLWFHQFDTQELLTDFALLFSEEYNIVKSSEWANLKPENGLDGFTAELVSKHNKKRVDNKTHNFLNRDNAILWNNQRVIDGTHNFLNSEVGRTGGKVSSKLRITNGTHNFLNSGDKKRNLALRPIYLEIKELYKNLGMKIPNNTYMRSDEYLEDIKNKLSCYIFLIA